MFATRVLGKSSAASTISSPLQGLRSVGPKPLRTPELRGNGGANVALIVKDLLPSSGVEVVIS